MDIKLKDKTLYIQLEGEIDHHNAQGLREKIDQAFEPTDCRQIVFDLAAVSFMDSSGIGMIIGRYKNANKRGGSVSVVGMNAEVSKIFQISGLAKIIDSYATLEEMESR